MKTTSKMTGEDRRAAIIKAARRVFVEKGFYRTTTRELAEAAGVSEALLFKHFPNKEALYSAIQMSCFNEQGSEIAERLQSLEPSTSALVFLVRDLVSHLLGGRPDERERSFVHLVLRSLMDEGEFARLAIQGGPSHWVQKVQECIEAARAAGDMVDETVQIELGRLVCQSADCRDCDALFACRARYRLRGPARGTRQAGDVVLFARHGSERKSNSALLGVQRHFCEASERGVFSADRCVSTHLQGSTAMRTVFVILVLIGGVGGGAAYYARHTAADPVTSFRTAAVKRGDLLSTISATGTVEPEEVVDVGAQVMGLILEFGPDPRDPAKVIDYGSVVEKGTVLARIDPAPYEAALEQAEATLERSEADQLQLEAKHEQAEQEWKRAPQSRRKAAEGHRPTRDYDRPLANYKVGQGQRGGGQGDHPAEQGCAARWRRPTSATRPSNRRSAASIIDRRVNIGQTVVASLNAPSLFLIAKDLRRMQVWASVNEADIGHIRVDMPVRFTVDAHAGRVFHGKVTQIRMNATMTQNVVTYTVVVTTDNSDGKLLPYLTANVQFEVDKRSDVLLVPNAALRWKPQASQIDPAARKTAICRRIHDHPGPRLALG